MYDSTMDTKIHRGRVRNNLNAIMTNLAVRATQHDRSKLVSPEKEGFDAMGSDSLSQTTYGTVAYHENTAQLGPALTHHYAAAENGHHPEHWPNGIRDMSLIDLLELLADWKAAAERTKDGSLARSLFVNRTRFGMQPSLARTLARTAFELGWIDEDALIYLQAGPADGLRVEGRDL